MMNCMFDDNILTIMMTMIMILMIYETNVSDPTDLSRGGDSFVGKLRSNMLGTQVMIMRMMRRRRRIKTTTTVMMMLV